VKASPVVSCYQIGNQISFYLYAPPPKKLHIMT